MAPLYENHNLVVFLIILGVAAGVVICWACFRFFYDSPQPDKTMSDEQKDYLREVKMRNVRDLAALNGRRDVYEDFKYQLGQHGRA